MIRCGMPAGEVMEILKAEGYSGEEISKVFKPSSYDLRGWLLFFSLLLALVGVYLFISQPDRPLLFLGLSFLLFSAYWAEVSRQRRGKNNSNKE